LAEPTTAAYNGRVVPPSSRNLVPGVAFDSYVVRELIGQGGMAAVYRAEHLLLNKPVALKVMNRGLLVSAPARQRFLLEGRAAASIKHPNVVDITDVGVHDGVPYLVMELLKGEDLEAYLRRRTVLDDGATIRLALPIISALHAAHTSGVVHRDIKPSNIFMSVGPDEQVVPKVLDFGISKVSFDDTKHELMTTPQHQLIGTPRYLPPEALQGARELGPLSDQYSLGVVLYQCVTGRTPFSGDTLVSLLNSLSRGTFEPPRALQPSVSPGLDRVITRALSAEPSERFPTIRDMGRALLELAAERTQMVWGQSFRSPSVAAEAAWLARAHELLPTPPGLPASTERLSHEPRSAARRWAAVMLGIALILVGVLAATLWSSFHSFSAVASKGDPVRPSTTDSPPAPAVATPPKPAIVETSTSSLTPRPVDPPKPEAEPRAAARPRPGRAQARRAATAAANRDERRAAQASAAAGENAPATSEPPRAVSPSKPAKNPRLGANRSPLLD
jgi:serine/threonine protein kinase